MQERGFVFILLQSRLFLLISLYFCLCLSPAFAASVHLSYTVEESGAVPVTVQGSFASCRVCDSNGENCHTVDNGSVSLHGYCSDSGHGSASCTRIMDRGSLHGSRTFTGSASDCKGSASDTLTITLDNTPTISISSPKGVVEGAFDMSGMVQFKPTLNETKGTLAVYFDNGGPFYRKTCKETDCSFSYLADTGKVFDINHGEHTVTVKAWGGGASNEEIESFTVDNMPKVELESPTGTVKGAFDIKGTVHFKPAVGDIQGSIAVYFDDGGPHYRKDCRETACSFSYLADKGSLFSLNHGVHKITVKAYGKGVVNNHEEEFTVDNMPEVELESPKDVAHGAFDIKGTVNFKPAVGDIQGTLAVYFDGGGPHYRKDCRETACSFSYLADKGSLFSLNHGVHKITVKAYGKGVVNDHEEEFTVDNMPDVELESPKGVVHGAFDIKGTVNFKPAVDDIQGTLAVYFDGGGPHYRKDCRETACSFSYLADKGSLFSLNHGVHKITVKAYGKGVVNNHEEEFTIDNMPRITIVRPIGGIEHHPLEVSGHVLFHPVLGDRKGIIQVYVDSSQRYSKDCTELSCNFSTMLSLSDNTASNVHTLRVRAISGGAVAEEERSFYFENIYSDQGCFNISNDQCSSCAQ